MNEFKFSCPQCGQHILCDTQSSGREINCPACQQMLVVPSRAPPAPPLAERAPPTRPGAAVAPLAVSRDLGRGNLGREHDPITTAGVANEHFPITSEGLVKLDSDTKLETFLMWGGAVALVVALGFGKAALLGHRRSPPNPEMLPIALWALPFCVAFFLALFFTDNYYLLDRERHRIFYHFKFLWFRRLRLFLQRKDIVAVAVQGRKHGERNQPTPWEYRIGVVGATGRWVALTDWQKKPLEPCNGEAAKLAAMLGCRAYAASPECELAVRKKGGNVSIAYVPLRYGLRHRDRWICLAVGLVVLGAILCGILSI
jgi:hypothetical protein